MAEKIGKLGASGLLIMFACGMTVLKIWQLDNDTWFIMNCGRYVVENGIPHEEFATIHEGLHYVMQQWLAAVIFWKIYSNFGADALIFFSWFIGFIMMIVYFKLCLLVSDGNKKISAIMSFIIGIFIAIVFIVTRPWTISTLFLLLEIFLLEKYLCERKIWTLCILPFLSAIFINIHAAMWSMMLIILLPYIVESFILNLKNISTPFLSLMITAAGIFFAGFINPYGLEAMTYVFRSTNAFIHDGVLEMHYTSAESLLGVFFFLFVSMLIIAFAKKNLPLRYFFLTFGITILAFDSIRSIFLFLVLATFPLAYALKNWSPFDNIFNIRHKLFLPLFLICIGEFYFIYIKAENSILEMHLPMKIIFALSIIFLLCFIFFYRKQGKLFSEEIFILRRKPLIALAVMQLIFFVSLKFYMMPLPKDEPYKPAIDFLLSKNRAEDISLWVGYAIGGGYAEFHGIKCYLDARAEIFTKTNNHKKDIFFEYYCLKKGILDYREFLSRYNFTHIFVTEDDTILYLMLSQDKNYKLLFEYELPENKGHGRIFVPVKK